MQTLTLIRIKDGAATIGTAENILKMNALIKAAKIEQVDSPDEQAAAVAAQQELHALAKAVEESRESLTGPLWKLYKSINSFAEQFIAEPKAEELRISRMLGDYQALLFQRAKAEEAKHNAALQAAEREREAAIAKATSLDEVAAINDQSAQKQAAIPTPPPRPQAEGQTVKKDWDITVTDPIALWRTHPACVELVPRLSEIRALLALGTVPKGVIAKEIIKSGVRSKPGQQLIEV